MKKLVGILLVLICFVGLITSFAGMKAITHILLVNVSENTAYVNDASSTTTNAPSVTSIPFTSFADMDEYLKAHNVSGTLVDVVEAKQYEIAQTPVVVTEEVETVTGYTYDLTEK